MWRLALAGWATVSPQGAGPCRGSGCCTQPGTGCLTPSLPSPPRATNAAALAACPVGCCAAMGMRGQRQPPPPASPLPSPLRCCLRSAWQGTAPAPTPAPTTCSPSPGRGDEAAPPTPGAGSPPAGEGDEARVAPGHVLSGVPRKRRGSLGSKEAVGRPSPYLSARPARCCGRDRVEEPPGAFLGTPEPPRVGCGEGRRETEGGGQLLGWSNPVPRGWSTAPTLGPRAPPGRSSALGHGAREP